jgi:ATP-binding cassette subfamily B protein
MEPPAPTLKKLPHSADAGVSTWRQKFAALASVPQFLRLAWQTHRGYASATVLLRLLRATVPIATLWVAKLIIDTVVAARMGRPNLSRLWLLVAVELTIVAVGEALDRGSAAVEALFGDLCANRINEKLIAHAGSLDLHHFDDPAFFDRLERAQRQTTGRIGLLTQLLTLGQDSVTLISLASAILFYSPWLLVLLIVAIVPGFLGEVHFSIGSHF